MTSMNKKNTSPSLSIYMHPRCFWTKKISGVARYVCELSRELFEMGHEVHIPIKETPTEYLLRASYFDKVSGETPQCPWYISSFAYLGMKTPLAAYFHRFIRRWEGAKALDIIDFDIVHPTHMNSLEILDHLHGKPLVVTVHDMTHELRPESFPAHDPSAARKKIMVERADRVIAISQQTKDDLVRLYGTDPDKVDVIHHGNSLVLPEEYEQMLLDIPKKYILFVGQRDGYKNFLRTLEAIKPLIDECPDLHLICAGGGKFKDNEIAAIKALGIERHVKQMWVTDEELAVLYNRAVCFIYPSEYEGFGLPILEAYECATPVLCAEASCFPEVAGDAAIYFDPTQVDEMTEKIRSMITDASLRELYIEKGRARVKLFSWRRCAEETLACYSKAMNSYTLRS